MGSCPDRTSNFKSEENLPARAIGEKLAIDFKQIKGKVTTNFAGTQIGQES